MINNKDNKSLGFGAWLSIVGLDRRIVQLEPEESFFSQGDSADCVYCLQAGRAKIGVVSEKGSRLRLRFSLLEISSVRSRWRRRLACAWQQLRR